MKYSFMVKMYQYFRIIFYLPVLLPSIFIYLFTYNEINLQKDIEQWKTTFHEEYPLKILLLIALLVKYRDFRNLFYYRLRMVMRNRNTSSIRKAIIGVLMAFSQIVLPRLNTLMIDGNIGGGLTLYHCYYGIICPENMGENCKIWHGVTIGLNKNKTPIIGNNVRISTGAVVIGGIKIGDNSLIGPNSLVVRNVTANSVVISEPSYIVKRDGKLVFERLDNALF